MVALLHQRNAFDRLRTNEVKMAEKGSEKYSELSWTSTESPWPMRRLSEQPSIQNIGKNCEQLESFELIVTDEITDHTATYSNLHSTQSLGNKELKKSSRLYKLKDINAP